MSIPTTEEPRRRGRSPPLKIEDQDTHDSRMAQTQGVSSEVTKMAVTSSPEAVARQSTLPFIPARIGMVQSIHPSVRHASQRIRAIHQCFVLCMSDETHYLAAYPSQAVAFPTRRSPQLGISFRHPDECNQQSHGGLLYPLMSRLCWVAGRCDPASVLYSPTWSYPVA